MSHRIGAALRNVDIDWTEADPNSLLFCTVHGKFVLGVSAFLPDHVFGSPALTTASLPGWAQATSKLSLSFFFLQSLSNMDVLTQEKKKGSLKSPFPSFLRLVPLLEL